LHSFPTRRSSDLRVPLDVLLACLLIQTRLPGSCAITVSPATTRCPFSTTTVDCGGISTSIREPNFTIPNRSPSSRRSPTFTWKTTRRATAPAICLNRTRWPRGCRTPISDRSFRSLDLGCQATRYSPGMYRTCSTVPGTGARFTWTFRGDRKIETRHAGPPINSSVAVGATSRTLPSAGATTVSPVVSSGTFLCGSLKNHREKPTNAIPTTTAGQNNRSDTYGSTKTRIPASTHAPAITEYPSRAINCCLLRATPKKPPTYAIRCKRMRKATLLPTLATALVLVGAGCGLSDQDTEREIVDRPLTSVERAVVKSDESFGLGLFSAVNETAPDENVVVSPLSVSMALGMALNGANGETHAEMLSALQKTGLGEAQINATYAHLLAYLPESDNDVEVTIAN